ncbi:MAG: hypothetical protein OXC26_12840 [Albidovulum sp.]|nr:hypothetical protein [Albidovulum sp.]
MLNLNGDSFAPNAASYYEEDKSLESGQTSIHVQIIIQGDKKVATLARLDPATPWVVLNAELNKTLGLGANGPNTHLQTAAGPMTGTLERCPIVLVAEEGQSLEIDATLFVCNEWRRGNFLGYTGLLERIRFAIDPASLLFYFGPAPE